MSRETTKPQAEINMITLNPGEHYGLVNSGWTPGTIVRDTDGQYYYECLSQDLKNRESKPLSEAEALVIIQNDCDE